LQLLENGNATNGGAITNQGTLSINSCTLQKNSASNYGGAINNEGDYGNVTVAVNANTPLNNSAIEGGAIINDGDYGNQLNATLNNNT
jgi:hypothetical protein